jgi:NitT/TauT family transport system substrate-binding protein
MLAYRAVALGVMRAVASALAGCCNNAPDSHPNVTLRLGHLTRITHASALVGIEKGLFADDIGPAAKLGVQPFGQSTEEATALRSGQIDSASVGPNPAFNAWQRSGGKAIKIISGWATGRSSLVVSSSSSCYVVAQRDNE